MDMRKLEPKTMRENYLRAARFNYPFFIPSFVSIPVSTWKRYGDKLAGIVEKHKLLFPWFRREMLNLEAYPKRPPTYRDEWGCVWRYTVDGLQGIVVENPLKDWSTIERFEPPDPELGLPREGEPPIPWSEVEAFTRSVKESGGLVVGFMPHGFLFLRLTYLRGYLNFLKDLATGPPQLERLVDTVVEYNVEVVKRLLRLGVDVVSFGDDLGTQHGLPYSPASFRRYLLPGYKRIFSEVKKKGVVVRLHSDGYVMDIASDLVSAGVEVLNIQDRLNGIDRMELELKGKVALEVDVDRQRLLPFGSPREIDWYVKETIRRLGSRRGGLLFSAEVLHDVPLENIKALLDALEKYSELHMSLPE